MFAHDQYVAEAHLIDVLSCHIYKHYIAKLQTAQIILAIPNLKQHYT